MFSTFKMRPSKYNGAQKRMAVVLVFIILGLVIAAFSPFSYAAYEKNTETTNYEMNEKRIKNVYIREFPISKLTFSDNTQDGDPLSGDLNFVEDFDPLSDDLSLKEDIDPLVADFESEMDNNRFSASIEKYASYLELNVPYVMHTDRDLSNLSSLSIQILTKVVDEESGFCPFEQQAAIAGLILNRLYAEEYPDTIFAIVSAPNQFRERYAYAPFPEVSEKTKAAVKCALDGIDFSCGAVAYYNPEYSTKAGIKYFETSTTMCAHIVDSMNLVLCCLNEHAEETLSMTKYYYSNNA